MTNSTAPAKTAESSQKFLQVLKGTKIDFLRYKWVALTFSSALCILGIIASIEIFWTNNANLGIEFTGGTSLTFNFERPIPLEEARALLISNGFVNPQVTETRDAADYKLFLRVKEGDAETPEEIRTIFTRQFADNTLEDFSHVTIGPSIGQELQDRAIYAIIYAIIGIILYIAVRFDYKFGVAATIAMFHDVLIIVGLMWLKNFFWPTEFTLLIMTAVLTMAGYSLTDTVVVFDRIRENLKRRVKLPLTDTINASINQVLSRTIIVSLTTFLVVTAIFILGGEVLHDFALALIIGVLAGTYSSIFVASPLLLLWRGGKSKLLGAASEVQGKKA